jgi:tagaturonate reductase
MNDTHAGSTPILQFGTSRFLLAHADLFISEALENGEAPGGITVVQTTGNAESLARIRALSQGEGYPVRVRGMVDGRPSDEVKTGRAVLGGLSAATDWVSVRRAFAAADIVISNTGDRGYELDARDTAETVADRSRPPFSFPAKLAALLLERFEERPDAAVSLYPCELIQNNGDRLQEIVRQLAVDWNFPSAFLAQFDRECHFANSLVDRIVSEAIQPVGAVCEPYGLWAIERKDGLILPCRHPSVVLTEDLLPFERLKLHILNLGHTVLAELWRQAGSNPDELVRDAIAGSDGQRLDQIWREEVLPGFASVGMGDEAADYIRITRERFENPFLDHRLADIAGNHAEKARRRIGAFIEWIDRDGSAPMPRLRELLEQAQR